MPATRRTKDDACGKLVVEAVVVNQAYNKGQADQQLI
jgi:hypothetical protein